MLRILSARCRNGWTRTTLTARQVDLGAEGCSVRDFRLFEVVGRPGRGRFRGDLCASPRPLARTLRSSKRLHRRRFAPSAVVSRPAPSSRRPPWPAASHWRRDRAEGLGARRQAGAASGCRGAVEFGDQRPARVGPDRRIEPGRGPSERWRAAPLRPGELSWQRPTMCGPSAGTSRCAEPRMLFTYRSATYRST